MSKVGFSRKDCKFIVNPEKRTVVCIIEHTRHKCVDFINFNMPEYVYLGQIVKKGWMPDRFVGIARCGENDEWNEDFGRELAYRRAKEKFNRSFFKHANSVLNDLDDALDNLAVAINGYGTKANENHMLLDDLLDGLGAAE